MRKPKFSLVMEVESRLAMFGSREEKQKTQMHFNVQIEICCEIGAESARLSSPKIVWHLLGVPTYKSTKCSSSLLLKCHHTTLPVV